jgi:hypothetical protein
MLAGKGKKKERRKVDHRSKYLIPNRSYYQTRSTQNVVCRLIDAFSICLEDAQKASFMISTICMFNSNCLLKLSPG